MNPSSDSTKQYALKWYAILQSEDHVNILYFVNRFPKLSESFIINEIHELERRGHQIAIFSLRRPEIGLQHEEIEHLEAKVGYLPDPSVGSALRAPGMWCINLPVLNRMIHTSPVMVHAGSTYIAGHCNRFIQSLDFEIDHVHGHFLNWPKLAADYVATHFGVPCTTTAHAYGLYSKPNVGLLRLLANRMDRVVTISEYNKSYLREDVGTNSPVDVVHMGINPEKFQPTGNSVVGRVLTVARFEEKKGIPYGIEAIGRMHEKVPEFKYHIVGSGSQEDLIRDRISEYDLEEVVSLLGHVDDDQLIRELDQAEVFLLPCVVASDGDRDGIPVALMEAMAMGTIPVSTSVSGIPELIDHGVNGFLTPPGDVEALSNVLTGILGDDEDYEIQLSVLRETIASDFDIVNCVTDLVKSFEAARNEFTKQ